MGFWEFLIQKEGDRSWLPLESPDVEILEGRYRVVARSNRGNTAVEVQITHIATAEDPPKRRTQKRSGHTNGDGLIVVIPFTRLQPGIWELSCAGDLMADFTGDGWHYTVKLQVLSHATEETDDWESDWQGESQPSSTSAASEPAISSPSPAASVPLSELERLTPVPPPAIAPNLESEADESDPSRTGVSEAIAASPIFQLATQLSQEVVDSVFQELDESPSTVAATHPIASPKAVAEPHISTADAPALKEVEAMSPSDSLSQSSASDLSASDFPPVRLSLTQETYTARRGETLNLTGQIEPLQALAPLPPLTLGLRIRLYDPQTAQTLFQDQRSLSVSTLPSSFECPVTIPDSYQTRLLLGDLALIAGAIELASQSFTVTADLTELLEALANAHMESDLVQPPLEFTTPATAADLDLTFLEFLQTPKPMLQFQASGKQAMPPQLNVVKSGKAAQPSQRSAIADPITAPIRAAAMPSTRELNPTATPNSATTETSPSSPIVPSTASPTNSPTGGQFPQSAPVTPTPVDLPPGAKAQPTLADLVFDDTTLTTHDWQSPSSPQTPPAKITPEPSPEDTAFRSLNLQNRFLSRLNALAGDVELSSWLRQDPIEALPVNQAPLGLDTDLAAQEVVIDDLPSYTTRPAAPVEPPPALILPEEEPVPAPELHIPAGELISGQSLFVTVKLPDVKPRIYVKLWILDRQTRSLLDGPRWFMAFVPDGVGNLETRTQITVPYGCLEASFEAIAVEMMTKRESHKVAIDRSIIPPDLPALPLEDLDL